VVAYSLKPTRAPQASDPRTYGAIAGKKNNLTTAAFSPTPLTHLRSPNCPLLSHSERRITDGKPEWNAGKRKKHSCIFKERGAGESTDTL